MTEAEIQREIHRLQDEEATWLEFCRVTCHVNEYIHVNNKLDVQTNVLGVTGQHIVQCILNQPSGDNCLHLCRMRPPAFMRLLGFLKQRYGFKSSRYISTEERLAFTLFILGHSAGMRLAHIFFGHSTATIHEHFHYVVGKLKRLSYDIIRPHGNYLNGEGAHSPTNPRHAVFQDCIGEMDSTHIPAVPPEGGAERHWNKKGDLTQNVLVIVDFNMCFMFAAAGWEGSTHDSRMLNEALGNRNNNFQRPSGNKYYLVDSGFPNKKGFLGPYMGQNARYHMQEFHRALTPHGRQPNSREEYFNYLHSSCRNIIERSFRVLKKRFLILQRMPEYEFDSQTAIVVVSMAVHNYLHMVDTWDPGFVAAMRPEYVPVETNDLHTEDAPHTSQQTSRDRHEWEQFRENITRTICGSWKMHPNLSYGMLNL